MFALCVRLYHMRGTVCWQMGDASVRGSVCSWASAVGNVLYSVGRAGLHWVWGHSGCAQGDWRPCGILAAVRGAGWEVWSQGIVRWNWSDLHRALVRWTSDVWQTGWGSSVNPKNDLLKLIPVEKTLLDLVYHKLYLSYATEFLIQFIVTRYLLIQLVVCWYNL